MSNPEQKPELSGELSDKMAKALLAFTNEDLANKGLAPLSDRERVIVRSIATAIYTVAFDTGGVAKALAGLSGPKEPT